MHAEVRMARIVEAIGRYKAGAVSCVEAAELLGMSERHFRRLRDQYEEEGPAGIIDRRTRRYRSGVSSTATPGPRRCCSGPAW